MARRPGLSLRALLFWCGEGAVLGQTASFLVGSESDVRHWGPWPADPVRPSGPCCFGVAKVPFVRLGGWKTASCLVGSESNVRHWGPWQEVLQAARARSKKQETRSKKQETRSQEATRRTRKRRRRRRRSVLHF